MKAYQYSTAPVENPARISDLTFPVYASREAASEAARILRMMWPDYWPNIRHNERMQGWICDAIRDSAG